MLPCSLNSTLQLALLPSTPLAHPLPRRCTPTPIFDLPITARPEVWGGDHDPVGTFRPSDVQFFCTILVHPKSFRINTCKSVSKQTTLSPFRINTYEKTRGRGRGVSPRVPEPSSFLSNACALFCTRQKLNPFIFNRFRTLCQKPPGVGGPFFDVQTFRRLNVQTIRPSHCSARSLVSQLAKAREMFAIRGNNSAPPGV